jgi:RDD family/zinc-ribbon domain
MALASFCQSCGTAISPGTQFCPSCGQRVGASQPSSVMSSRAFPGPGTSPRPAGFWLRVVALIFDQLIIGVPALIATPFGNVFLETPFFGPYFLGVFVVWPWLYFAVMESSSKQATFGKRILGLVVTDSAYQRISFRTGSRDSMT